MSLKTGTNTCSNTCLHLLASCHSHQIVPFCAKVRSSLCPGTQVPLVLGAGYIIHNIPGMYRVIDNNKCTTTTTILVLKYPGTSMPYCALPVGKRTTSNLQQSEREAAGKEQGDEREREGVGGDDSEATGMHSWPHGDTMVARSAVALPCQCRHAIASDARACQCTVLRVSL